MNKTPLHARHQALGARMIDFGGWDMPVSYSDIAGEHAAVRKAAGLFDLCHMGRVAIRGRDAEDFVQAVQTNDLERIGPNQIRYALLLHDDGNVIDDILVHRRAKDVFLVVNAGNRDRDLARLVELRGDRQVEIDDCSESLSMIAVQGPASAAIVKELVGDAFDVDEIGYYRLAEGELRGRPGMITRTGYTGEDGFELYVDRAQVGSLWDRALEVGAPHGLVPCGLGARDTLRLEAGMPLYGHEITDTINPIEAGLMFGVRLQKPAYPGRDALTRIKEGGPARRLIGLAVDGRRIPREGHPVLLDGREVGRVASGTWSPTFERAVATALVEATAAERKDGFEVDIRGRRSTANAVDLPFYKRDGSGSLMRA